MFGFFCLNNYAFEIVYDIMCVWRKIMSEILIIASNNKHKIKEFKELFKGSQVLSMQDVGFCEDVVEDGKTFLDNALIKARTLQTFLKSKNIIASVIADDSGLCVDALNGAPGVFSARYAGEHGNDQENRDLLLKNLKEEKNRNAHFCCNIVKMFSDGYYLVGVGKTFGSITQKEIGDTSFGYDCLFLSADLNKTFGEASAEEKNSVSHRARALQDLQTKQKNFQEQQRTIQIVPALKKEIMRVHFYDYLTELSEFDPDIKFDENHVPIYNWFDCYWEDKDRFPIFFWENNKLAGLAMIRELDNMVYDIAEFYVIPEYRKNGNAMWFALELTKLFDGEFCFSTRFTNPRAIKFWDKFSKCFDDFGYTDDEIWRNWSIRRNKKD